MGFWLVSGSIAALMHRNQPHQAALDMLAGCCWPLRAQKWSLTGHDWARCDQNWPKCGQDMTKRDLNMTRSGFVLTRCGQHVTRSGPIVTSASRTGHSLFYKKASAARGWLATGWKDPAGSCVAAAQRQSAVGNSENSGSVQTTSAKAEVTCSRLLTVTQSVYQRQLPTVSQVCRWDQPWRLWCVQGTRVTDSSGCAWCHKGNRMCNH